MGKAPVVADVVADTVADLLDHELTAEENQELSGGTTTELPTVTGAAGSGWQR